MYINSGVGFARQSAGHTPNTLRDFTNTVVKWGHFSDFSGLKTMYRLSRKFCKSRKGEGGGPQAKHCSRLCTEFATMPASIVTRNRRHCHHTKGTCGFAHRATLIYMLGGRCAHSAALQRHRQTPVASSTLCKPLRRGPRSTGLIQGHGHLLCLLPALRRFHQEPTASHNPRE